MHKYFQGEKFGRLTLVGLLTEPRDKRRTWECLCECGNTTFVRQISLVSGDTKSCGCLKLELLAEHNAKWNSQTVNEDYHHIYNSWGAMIKRCYHKHNNVYTLYGARGITVCDEWKDNFLLFLDWSIKNGWQLGLSIDRIDNNGNYRPENCRWATTKTQSNNRRSNRLITIDSETKTLAQWSETSGIKSTTIARRIDVGWDMTKWLIKPFQKNREEI